MNTFRQDFGSPLTEIDRAWLRIPVTLFLAFFLVLPLLVVVGALRGSKEAWEFFIWPGLTGEDSNKN
jgi:hypothetical protein